MIVTCWRTYIDLTNEDVLPLVTEYAVNTRFCEGSNKRSKQNRTDYLIEAKIVKPTNAADWWTFVGFIE